MHIAGRSDAATFLGVPFAKPPTGRPRWHAPESPDSWSDIRKTDSFGPACSQLVTGRSGLLNTITEEFEIELPEPLTIDHSQDCLHLNG